MPSEKVPASFVAPGEAPQDHGHRDVLEDGVGIAQHRADEQAPERIRGHAYPSKPRVAAKEVETVPIGQSSRAGSGLWLAVDKLKRAVGCLEAILTIEKALIILLRLIAMGPISFVFDKS